MIDKELENNNIADENSDLIDNSDLENEEDQEDEPGFDPECTESTEDDEIECEFEVKDGSWWCNTHNC